jgi:hypothetical protein
MTPSHYKMTELSDREKTLITEMLHAALSEGGQPLRMVAKKFIMTVYWSHMTNWVYYDYFGTVAATLLRVKPKPGEKLENRITAEVYSLLSCGYYDRGFFFGESEFPIIYRGIGASAILSKDPISMKTFETELRCMIEKNKEINDSWLKILGNSMPKSPSPDLPF